MKRIKLILDNVNGESYEKVYFRTVGKYAVACCTE